MLFTTAFRRSEISTEYKASHRNPLNSDFVIGEFKRFKKLNMQSKPRCTIISLLFLCVTLPVIRATSDPYVPCRPPRDPGPCRACLRSWYYDIKSNKCRTFCYGGCRGNSNRFNSQAECENRCVRKVRPVICPAILIHCFNYCPYGHGKDSRGCPSCRCKSAPTAPATLCTKKRGSAQGLLGSYIPQCDKNGNFLPMQCHGSTGHCWCVDKYGREVPGSRKRAPSRPNCDKCAGRPMCLLGCPFGLAKGPDGCPICKCKRPPKPVTCPLIQCMIYCPHGRELNSRGCPSCKCKSAPLVKCPAIGCVNRCPYGFMEDSRGCPSCICKLSPTASCPKVLCEVYCKYGFQKDSRGCEMCKCNPTPVDTGDVCLLPKISGRCRAYFRRYYYDDYEGACLPFVYGGCGGNKNNFRSLEECEDTCY